LHKVSFFNNEFFLFQDNCSFKLNNFVQPDNFNSFSNNCTVLLPDTLGPVESLPEYLGSARDNEESAWDLQGLIFHDEDLGWCKISDWGVDHGTNIVFYAPVGSQDPEAEEEHASLAEVLAWIQQSPEHPRITDYRSSRELKKSNTRADVHTLMVRCLHVKRRRPTYGTVLTIRGTDKVSGVKMLKAKTIIRILKAQESMFKYGTFIPRTDREAEQIIPRGATLEIRQSFGMVTFACSTYF
jgi:hypothetical protein